MPGAMTIVVALLYFFSWCLVDTEEEDPTGVAD